MQRVTLARVAAAAGVSTATVSKVLNGRGGVSDRTRVAVIRLAEEIGYIPVADRERPMRGEREPIVEVLADSLDNPYTSTFLNGVVTATQAAGGSTVIRLTSAVPDEHALRWAKRLARAGRLGVIEVTVPYSKAREDALRAVGLHLVLVDPIEEPRTHIYSLGATNWAGGLDATRHLLSLGHRRIAYIGGPVAASANAARARGYFAALHERGIALDPSLVAHGSFTFEHGLRAATAMLDRRVRPTAFFAGCDVAALGVIEAARRLGITVPEDLSLVGFDDSGAAASSAPPLTTIHQPILEVGAAAVTLLYRLASGDASAPRRMELATRLVLRASTAIARGEDPRDQEPGEDE